MRLHSIRHRSAPDRPPAGPRPIDHPWADPQHLAYLSRIEWSDSVPLRWECPGGTPCGLGLHVLSRPLPRTLAPSDPAAIANTPAPRGEIGPGRAGAEGERNGLGLVEFSLVAPGSAGPLAGPVPEEGGRQCHQVGQARREDFALGLRLDELQ